MTKYQKAYLTVAEQLALLEQRGMVVTNRAKAEECLSRIGYYRLSAYSYPFRMTQEVLQPNGSTALVIDNRFRSDTHFETVVQLYGFDKRLRLLMLDALERIEVSLRTGISLHLGRFDPCAYRDPQYFDRSFVSPPNPNRSHSVWLQRFDEKASYSRETFAEHFRTKYPGSQFPIWIATELLDFGALSMLLAGMRYRDQQYITQSYNIPRPQLLVSWIRMLSVVRNVSAHHSRLWNRPLVDQPKVPRRGELPELEHLFDNSMAQRRFYAAAAICRFMLRIINPTTSWPERLKAHIATFPVNPYVSFGASGFPIGWENERLWQP